MIDHLISSIEQVSAEGAVVLVKWDGERDTKRGTVVITRRDTDYVWRQDTDDVSGALQTALLDYRSHHAKADDTTTEQTDESDGDMPAN